jgi:hypothetical protein
MEGVDRRHQGEGHSETETRFEAEVWGAMGALKERKVSESEGIMRGEHMTSGTRSLPAGPVGRQADCPCPEAALVEPCADRTGWEPHEKTSDSAFWPIHERF